LVNLFFKKIIFCLKMKKKKKKKKKRRMQYDISEANS